MLGMGRIYRFRRFPFCLGRGRWSRFAVYDGANPVEPRAYLSFIAATVGMIVFTPDEHVRHVLLFHHRIRVIMGVVVPFVVAPRFHQCRGCIANMQRHLTYEPRIHIGQCLIDGRIAGI